MQYRSIRNKLSFEFFFLSLSLPLSHIHINKFTQIFDAYVHNRFRKYLAFTRWKDKLEPTVLFQIFERSRAFPAISIWLNFCATFPWRVFDPGKIFVAARPAYFMHAPGWKKGIWLHAKTFSSSFDIWPSFSKRSSSSCSFRTGTRYFARDVPKRRLLPSRESGVKSFKRRYSNFPWEIFNSSGLEQIFAVVEFDSTICKLF